MSQPAVSGVCPVVDTPFTEDGDVDFESLDRLVQTLTAEGSDALALFGYATEFYKLSTTERKQMLDRVLPACEEENIPSVVSVTAEATNPAIENAGLIEQAGADVIMVLPPHTRGPPEPAIAEHLTDLAGSVSVPVMIQYAPGSTGVTHDPEFFASLYRNTENIDLFKIECDPPGKFISRLLELTDGQADVLVGRAGLEMIEGYDRGAIGVMPASAMYDIYLEIHRRYHEESRDSAIDLHAELVAVLNQLTKLGIAWEKRILAKRGLIETAHCRKPEETFDEVYDQLFDDYYEKFVMPHITD